MFALICVWINDWVNNREAGDLRRNRAHYDVIVMLTPLHTRNMDGPLITLTSRHDDSWSDMCFLFHEIINLAAAVPGVWCCRQAGPRVDLPRSVGDISLNWALSSPGIEITLSSWQCLGFKILVSLAFGKVLYINPRVYNTVAFIHILKYTPFDKSNDRLLLDEFKWNFPNLKLDVFLISPKFDGDCHYKNHHRTSADQCVSFFTSLRKRAKIMVWKFHMNPSNFSPRN